MIAFLQTPIGIVCAIAAAILAIRCFGELLALAAKAAVVLLMLGVVAYFLGWQPPMLSGEEEPEIRAAPAQPHSVPVRWRI